jgi:DNA invertase Pin-like site-specific DNA recombinase
MTVHCAIYTRTAAEAGGSNSARAQRERAAAYIERRRSDGWEIHPEVYDDHGTSGLTLERPALRRLIRDARAGKFQVLVGCDIDRLTRSRGTSSRSSRSWTAPASRSPP